MPAASFLLPICLALDFLGPLGSALPQSLPGIFSPNSLSQTRKPNVDLEENWDPARVGCAFIARDSLWDSSVLR